MLTLKVLRQNTVVRKPSQRLCVDVFKHQEVTVTVLQLFIDKDMKAAHSCLQRKKLSFIHLVPMLLISLYPPSPHHPHHHNSRTGSTTTQVPKSLSVIFFPPLTSVRRFHKASRKSTQLPPCIEWVWLDLLLSTIYLITQLTVKTLA